MKELVQFPLSLLISSTTDNFHLIFSIYFKQSYLKTSHFHTRCRGYSELKHLSLADRMNWRMDVYSTPIPSIILVHFFKPDGKCHRRNATQKRN